MDLGNAVRRTQQAQQALDEKMDRLMALFNPPAPGDQSEAAVEGGAEPLTGETPAKPIIDGMFAEINAKLDLLMEAVANLQPASKKKAKADPASTGDAAGDAAAGGE
jgi:hypothetical protein